MNSAYSKYMTGDKKKFLFLVKEKSGIVAFREGHVLEK